MRSMWNGAIGFGLVNIPVKLYSARESETLDLDMLDKKDKSRIRFKRVNETTGEEVEWKNIVKAYNYNGEYVVLEKEDFKSVNPEKSKLLRIQQFVNIEEIDSIYFEDPYFLEPQKNGEEAYQLLLEALKTTQMAGLGTFILREKELLCVIRPYKNKVLIVNKMRYPEEIRSYEELDLPTKEPTEAEVNMAIQLINQSKKEFNPADFKNEYEDRLMDIIKAKATGVPNTEVEAEDSDKKKGISLMEQLKASLQESETKAS